MKNINFHKIVTTYFSRKIDSINLLFSTKLPIVSDCLHFKRYKVKRGRKEKIVTTGPSNIFFFCLKCNKFLRLPSLYTASNREKNNRICCGEAYTVVIDNLSV